MSPRSSPGAALVGLLLGPFVVSASRAAAFDLSGSALVANTATDNRGIQSDLVEQRYSLGLSQPLTPFLSFRFSYDLHDLTTAFDAGPRVTRRTQLPRFQLTYSEPEWSARLAVYQQSVENTLQPDSFDRKSLAANLVWQPAFGLALSLDVQKEENVADVSVFGSDLSSRLLELKALYGRKSWTTSYTFNQIVLDNRSNELRSDQGRHEARFSVSQSFWSRGLALSLDGQLGRLNRTTRAGDEADLAEPLPAVEGLFAVDTTPELGELEPSPSLIDGDIETPASPPIDIGGANTLRNVGVDLGITRPVTRLEIAVDTVSGPQLSWLVYHSRDNLFWEPLPGVTSEFDGALLRYRLRFPETEDRFFKAVNISVNPTPEVFVTEVRALRDLDAADLTEAIESDLYRADLVASFRPARRVRGAVGLGLSNDQTLSAGLVRRDFEEVHAFARISVDLARDLGLHLGYRFNDSEDLRPPVLLRTVNRYSASLRWFPLPTVDAILTASHRGESEKGTSIQSLQSVRLGVVTELLPDLRLVTDLTVARLDDPFAGRARDTWTWRETLEMRPLPTWTVSGGFTWSRNEAREGGRLLGRTQYRVLTTWNPTAYLTMGGTWWYTNDDGRTSLNQSYYLSYSPGDRLTVSATYQGFEGMGVVATSTNAFGLTYRLFTQFAVFANLSRSRTEESGGESAEISNFRAGLRLAF